MAIRTVCAFGGEASALQRFERELMAAKMGGVSGPAAPRAARCAMHQAMRLAKDDPR